MENIWCHDTPIPPTDNTKAARLSRIAEELTQRIERRSDSECYTLEELLDDILEKLHQAEAAAQQ